MANADLTFFRPGGGAGGENEREYDQGAGCLHFRPTLFARRAPLSDNPRKTGVWSVSSAFRARLIRAT